MKEILIQIKDLGNEEFDGDVTVEILKYTDRLKYSSELNLKTGADGEFTSSSDMIQTTIKMIDLAEKHIKKVYIKNIKTGDIAHSFEEMQCNPSFDVIIPTIAGLVFSAGRVGK